MVAVGSGCIADFRRTRCIAHEQIRPRHLGRRRNAARGPVVNALDAAIREAKQRRNFRGTPKGGDQRPVVVNGAHASIKHHV